MLNTRTKKRNVDCFEIPPFTQSNYSGKRDKKKLIFQVYPNDLFFVKTVFCFSFGVLKISSHFVEAGLKSTGSRIRRWRMCPPKS